MPSRGAATLPVRGADHPPNEEVLAMRQFRPWFGVLLLAALAIGCGSTPEPVIEEPPPPPPIEPEKIGDHIELSLAALLDKPRSELAALTTEVTTKIKNQEAGLLDGRFQLALLPELRFSLSAPILREAQFSSRAGFSLPPYMKEDARDASLALHLARYGDVEAAKKLAPPDAAFQARLDAWRLERNYPVEWTRLVALMLDAAQIQLASGDVHGATHLRCLHQQLREVLGPKAASGPLGALLLPRGHAVFAQAAAAWKKENRSVVTEQAEAIVAGWGELPPPPWSLKFGGRGKDVAALLDSPCTSQAIVARSINRALDVFELPLPGEGIDSILACLDAKGNLEQVLVLYRARIVERFPDPARLALLLEDYARSPQDKEKAGWLACRSYTAPGFCCEVTVANRGSFAGALATFQDPSRPTASCEPSRDFGSVHLSRSFDQNRARLAPEAAGEVVTVDRPKVLGSVTNWLGIVQPARLTLRSANKSNVTASLTLDYTVGQPAPSLSKLALPLWSAWGASQIEGETVGENDYLSLVWQDARTRLVLRVPVGSAGQVSFAAEDRQWQRNLDASLAQVASFDQVERKERFAAGKPFSRIRRSVPGIDGVQLGMQRFEVSEALGERQDILQRPIPGGLAVTFAGEPQDKVVYLPRQLFIRFDARDRVTELRVRYDGTENATDSTAWTNDLANRLKKSYGQPIKIPVGAAAAESDQSQRQSTATHFRWTDDTTLLSCQCDGTGAEIVLRDCPLEHPRGIPLPPLEYMPRGPEGCAVGERRGDLVQRGIVSRSTPTADGSLVVPGKAGGPYDQVTVWFDQDQRVVRVLAHHRQDPRALKPEQAAEKLQEAWGRDIKQLGWTRRQNQTPQRWLQSLSWEDDRTRLRIYWEREGSAAPQLFSEWNVVGAP
jgi:hypothetical protein